MKLFDIKPGETSKLLPQRVVKMGNDQADCNSSCNGILLVSGLLTIALPSIAILELEYGDALKNSFVGATAVLCLFASVITFFICMSACLYVSGKNISESCFDGIQRFRAKNSAEAKEDQFARLDAVL